MLQYINLRSELYYAVAAMRDNGERGQLLMAILQFANGIEPDKLPATVEPIFAMVRAQMERDSAAYEAKANVRRENGRKGGRPKNLMVSPETKQNLMVSPETKQNSKEKKRKEKEVEGKTETVFPETASAAFDIPDDELARRREENERVDMLIRHYGFPDTDYTRGELLADAEKYGHDAQEAAIKAAAASNKFKGISVSFYRACLKNAEGGGMRERGGNAGTWGKML